MPNTESEVKIMRTIRTHLLTFEPIDGSDTLAERLGTATGAGADGKLYIEQAPDPTSFPWGLMHMLPSRTQGDDARFQKRYLLEINLFGYPRNTQLAISAMADLVEAAWRDYRSLAIDDAIVSQGIDLRENVAFTDPANREIARTRLLLPFYATPYYLAQYSSEPVL